MACRDGLLTQPVTKTSFRLHQLLTLCLALICLIITANLRAQTAGTETNKPIEISIPSANGNLRGLKVSFEILRGSVNEPVCTIYIPKTGVAWTGGFMEENNVVAGDHIFGFWYPPQSRGTYAGEMLSMSVSGQRYAPNEPSISKIVKNELERFLAGRGRHGNIPPYSMRLEDVFGPEVLRDKAGPTDSIVVGTNLFSLVTRPSKLQGVTVEGTNAVVAIQFGTNMLAKIAFDRNMRPVWATTNGVSIGPIPTNTVFLRDFVSGWRSVKVY